MKQNQFTHAIYVHNDVSIVTVKAGRVTITLPGVRLTDKTANRINHALNKFQIPAIVWKENGHWWIDVRGKVIAFDDIQVSFKV